MTDLHITNGDGAADIIRASVITGEVLPWRDPMHHGPFPLGLDLDDLSAVRGRYLAGPDLDASEIIGWFRQRDGTLRAAANYDRVVLWYEHDLLDQLQILQLLDWFSDTDLADTRLEMICIDAFPGIEPFRGIGQLDVQQMASLFDLREAISPAQMALARAAWRAFRSADPCSLESFMSGDLTPLPFLQPALMRHLEEYPAMQSGLTRTESQILSLVADGISDPASLFVANMELESAYFIGDWPTFRHIGDLCAGDDPMLRSGPDGPFWFPPHTRRGGEAFRRQRLELTETGRQVLAGERGAFGILQRDQWLGGVHLQSGEPRWTWNADDGRLELRST